ncbi:histone-lysine N-methyltransferase SETMAR-like [Vespa crabro]|uniref:histone-lysine N-methyltransferase SETMAR-like n=1 Tax=Vespa crabro TaxID=7445 RepID=UPI001F02AED2|nr:histone-lysine N-methyltransferase SETMAR-like [Vespa crabro]
MSNVRDRGAKKMCRIKAFPKILPDNTTINSEVNCHQLDEPADAFQHKRPELINRIGVVFQQHNARPNSRLIYHQKLLQLEWARMPDAPYYLELASSDYYLLRSLQNFLDGKTFTSNELVKYHLVRFFVRKHQKFYDRQIILLPERWQNVMKQNGQKII